MRLNPPGNCIFPEPRSFFWLPIAGQRHAAETRYRDLPYGELVGTLCGQQLKRAPVTDMEWLWPTCPACWSATAARVGCGHEPRQAPSVYGRSFACCG
ncbi:MAG: zinc finger protein [Pseudonocardiaceae bacterium]